jgi:hypothetical protein
MKYFFTFLFFVIATHVVAQQKLPSYIQQQVDNTTLLEKISYYKKLYAQQQNIIRNNGLLNTFSQKIGDANWKVNQKNIYIAGFYDNMRPKFIQSLDTFACNTMWTNRVTLPYSTTLGTGLHLTGANYTVAIIDEGIVQPTHEKFGNRGRIKSMEPDTVIYGSHATGVAGSLAADNSDGNPTFAKRTRGTAINAHIKSWDYTNANAKIATMLSNTGVNGPILISNHSYGEAVGWIPIGSKWYWLGDTTQTQLEDEKCGWYSSDASYLDTIAHANPYHLMFWAAGNSRLQNYSGPHNVLIFNADGTFTVVPSNTPRAPIGLGKTSGDGYDVILPQQTAKNILTVGSMETILNGTGYVDAASTKSFNFSSAGPTDDGRIKPEVVTPGWGFVPSVDVSDTSKHDAYGRPVGTSISSPFAAGSGILMHEHYKNTHSNWFNASTLKALMINTTHEMGAADGPDYRNGFGLVNTKGGTDLITKDNENNRIIFENTLQNNNKNIYNITAAGNEPISITIVWNDPPAAPTPANMAFDNKNSKLVNDLDMIAKDANGNICKPYILDPLNPELPATRGDNFRDNVEQIKIYNVPSNTVLTIEVTHKNNLQNNKSQQYSIVINGTVSTQLPILFSIPLNATALNNKHVLNFTVENQVAGTIYTIEKLDMNNNTFISIGTLNENGINNILPNAYTFINSNINLGANTYRIKATKPNQQVFYSNTATIIKNGNALINITPNPATEYILVNVPNVNTGNVDIQIIDSKGSLVFKQQTSLPFSNNVLRINTNKFANGVYRLRLQGAIKATTSFIVNR